MTGTIPRSPDRFTNFTFSPVSGLCFIFRDGSAGRQCRIQISSSLTPGSWEDWQSFAYSGPVGFMDMAATGAEWRFYRAVSP